jgi:hypothetical protein
MRTDTAEQALLEERQRVTAAQQALAAAEGELGRERQARAAEQAAAEQARLRAEAAAQEMQQRVEAAQASVDEMKGQKMALARNQSMVQQQLNELLLRQQQAAPLVQRFNAAAPAADVASLTQQLGAANLEQVPRQQPQEAQQQAQPQAQPQQPAASHIGGSAANGANDVIDLLSEDEDEAHMEAEGGPAEGGAAPAAAPSPVPLAAAEAQLEQVAAASPSRKRLAELAAEAVADSMDSRRAADFLVSLLPHAQCDMHAQLPSSLASCLHVRGCQNKGGAPGRWLHITHRCPAPCSRYAADAQRRGWLNRWGPKLEPW